MPNRPPSIRDIARACGYSKSAVAAVLSNSPEIPAATAAIIRESALRLGYRRDPVVADLAARRWRARPNAVWPLLAYVYDFGEERVTGEMHLAHLGCEAAAQGYRIEEVNLRTFSSDRHASRVLHARGYRGLLVGRILRRDRPLELEWGRFTAVASDLGFVRPPLHLVTQDRFAATLMATRAVLANGYRRPGFVHLVHSAREELEPTLVGGFLMGASKLPPRDRLPVHVGSFHDAEGAGFTDWLAGNRPDVVIGHNNLVLWWVRRAGLKVPDDVAFVSLEREGRGLQGIAGLARHGRASARAAVELLVGQIHLNARGVPSPVQTVLIEPVWTDGTTLPPRHERCGRHHPAAQGGQGARGKNPSSAPSSPRG